MSRLTFFLIITAVITGWTVLDLAEGATPSGRASEKSENPWSAFVFPKDQAEAAAIGGYAAGCVAGAVSLPPDGTGYQVMRPGRRRFYGHPALVKYIEGLGKKVHRGKLGVMLVGDLAQPRGGPSLTGHRSHQNGLDVDIWYWLDHDAKKRSLTLGERETLSALNVVRSDGKDVRSGLWAERHNQMLMRAAQPEDVDRIFVAPAIKKRLCDRFGGKAAWLRKVRPWYGHADHFHVRLKCPKGEKSCKPQLPVPPGSGCDASLAWWFTDEARREASKRSGPASMPNLPAACDNVVST